MLIKRKDKEFRPPARHNSLYQFYDTLSDTHFISTIRRVQSAINESNAKLLLDGYVSTRYLYDKLGITDIVRTQSPHGSECKVLVEEGEFWCFGWSFDTFYTQTGASLEPDIVTDLQTGDEEIVINLMYSNNPDYIYKPDFDVSGFTDEVIGLCKRGDVNTEKQAPIIRTVNS